MLRDVWQQRPLTYGLAEDPLVGQNPDAGSDTRSSASLQAGRDARSTVVSPLPPVPRLAVLEISAFRSRGYSGAGTNAVSRPTRDALHTVTATLNRNSVCAFDSVQAVRLTKFTDLALRSVMRLAVSDDGDPLTTREVAAAMDVRYTHVAKAITRLQHLGVVEARRGRGGGLALTSLGRRASVGWLVRELEGEDEVVACDDPPCPLRGACRLRRALRDAQEAFYAALDPLTVADLVASPTGPVLVGLIGRPQE